MSIVVATFYHFFDFANRAAQRDAIFAQLDQLGVRGTLLLTPEGINSTLSGTRAAIDAALAYLKSEVTRADFEHKESFCAEQPFARLKVKLKKETISLGEEACVIRVGTYVAAEDWNALITQPDVVVIDTRNDYEYHLGTFQGAVNPDIANFRQLPAFARALLGEDKTRRIATFCTGGIRCEKFTAWLLAQGYQNVYHLKGGILKYLEDIPPADSMWVGECFVFDDRVAVGHGLVPSTTASLCPVCSYTLTPEDYAHPDYVAGAHCPHCDDLRAAGRV